MSIPFFRLNIKCKVQIIYFAPIYMSIIFESRTLRLTFEDSYTECTKYKRNIPPTVPDLKLRETEG
jgi:hypothetical protein